MKKVLLFTLFVLVFALGAGRSAFAQDIRIDGIGAQRCGTVVSSYEARPSTTGTAMISWAYGYMTRRNIERTANGLQPVNLQPPGYGPEQMLKTLLGVCEKRPDVPFVIAVDALFDVIREYDRNS